MVKKDISKHSMTDADKEFTDVLLYFTTPFMSFCNLSSLFISNRQRTCHNSPYEATDILHCISLNTGSTILAVLINTI